MAEFQANAITLVGNFSGPCIIYLTGEAITVKQGNGVEIAKWPYNCIRQFKAEDETGKFSFVSGRRGPYGVAEYNFGLDDVSDLQHALSQFTGAQFSQAPPTTQQPPLPPLPPVPHGQRPPSTSSFSRYSMGGRTDSIDSVFSSPGHARVHAPHTPGPRLPPRDYLLHSTDSGSSISNSLLSNSGGGYSFSRSRNSTSAGDILESASPASSSSPPLSQKSCVPQPSLSRGGGGYMSAANDQYQNHRGVMDKQTKTEIGGNLGRARKSSPGTSRRVPPLVHSESRDEVPDLPPRDTVTTRPKTNSTGSMAPPTSSSDNKSLKKQLTEPSISHKPALAPKPNISPKPKRLGEKHLPPSSTSPSPEHTADKTVKSSSTTVTPEPQLVLSGTTSPAPDATDLDHIPRSSPQVSRTLRNTLKGRQSPVGRLTKSTTTPSLHAETYDVPKALKSQLSADDGGALYNNVTLSGETPPKSEDMYQVPRPTVDSEYHVPRPTDDVMNEKRHYHHPKPSDEVYKVPRPMSGSYSSLLVGQMSNNLYSNPRPPVATRSPQGVYYSYPPDSEGTDGQALSEESEQQAAPGADDGGVSKESSQLYGNITLSGEQGGTAEENFYNVPRPGGEQQDLAERSDEQDVSSANVDDGLYNVPRPQPDAQNSPPKGSDDLYKVPRRLVDQQEGEDGLYKVPRQSGSESPPPRNPYEMVDLDQPRQIRPARSLESLHRVRTLPPRAGNRYVGLNVDNPSSTSSTLASGRSVSSSWIQKQPLPPRPTQDSSMDDNLYAEIPDDLAKNRHRMANGRQSPPARMEHKLDNLYVDGPEVALDPSKKRHSNYDKLPPRRPSPDIVASEGVAKAKELAKQGYELCLPSGEDPRLSPRTPPITTPPRNIPRRHFSSVDKYDLKLHGDTSSRTHRSVMGSESGATSSPPETLLGSSIPSDSTKPTTDEYVIITRSDTRLKYSQQTQSSEASSGPAGDPTASDKDEYEEMTSVKAQILLNQSTHYSSPNPSLRRDDATPTNATTTASDSTEVVGGASDHLYGNTEHTNGDFSNLDRATRLPFTEGRRLVRAETLPPRRKTVSASSNDSDVFVTSQGSSASGGAAVPAEKKFVRIASGGIPEAAGSAELRLRSCSVDDYLDNGRAEKPKRHSYVNVPNDATESSETNKQSAESATETSQPPAVPKKPKPFPRTSTLRRTDSDEQKQ